MVSLWTHDPKPRASQAHRWKGSSGQLRIHPTKHRASPESVTELGYTHQLRQASATQTPKPSRKRRGHLRRPLRRRSIPEESLRCFGRTLHPFSRIFQS